MSAATTTKPAASAAPAAEAGAKPAIYAAIPAEGIPLADLLRKVDPAAVALAWAAGEVEFGRAKYTVTGGVKRKDAMLVIEGGMSWTGPKTRGHQTFLEILAAEKELPACGEYRRYKEPPPNYDDLPPAEKEKSPLLPLTEAEAHRAIGLVVRLTDAGIVAAAAA